MAMHYSDQRRASDPHALPNVETFHARIVQIDCARCGESELPEGADFADLICRSCEQAPQTAGFVSNADGTPKTGWFYWFCFPGCLPDGEPMGPFATEQEALADARAGVTDEDGPDDDDDDDPPVELDSATRAYLETALWSSTDDDGESLDGAYTVDDCSVETVNDARADLADFYDALPVEIRDAYTAEALAHDFWLTRNRHGAGFWDGDYPREIGQLLTERSHGYGSVDLSVGDDGKIHGA